MIIQFFLFFCFVLPFTCEEMNPLYPDEKWEKVSPREVGIDAVKLQNLSKMGRDRGNIAVFRYGRLCFTDGLMAKNFPVYSVGKTLIAMIAGKLLREEKIRLDDALELSNNPILASQTYNQSWFLDGYVGGPLRTFREFLSMQSDFGLQIDEQNPSERQCAYNNNAVQFYGTYLNEKFIKGKSEIAFIKKSLFNTLGLQHNITFKGQLGGYMGGFGFSCLDIARAGHLLAQNGKWKNEQILSSNFVNKMFASQVNSTIKRNKDRSNKKIWNIYDLTEYLPYNAVGYPGRMGGDLGYGFGIWLINDEGVGHLSGLKGNYVIVDREEQLVISVTNYQDTHPTAPEYYKIVKDALLTTQKKNTIISKL